MESPLFPRLQQMRDALKRVAFGPALQSHEPALRPDSDRVRMLEAKVEYLLDEVYGLKQLLRWHGPTSAMMDALHRGQIETFDYQWTYLPDMDKGLDNPAWRAAVVDDACRRVEKPPEWFRGKKVIDCGCGSGRYTWALAKLGANVTAFDTSEGGLAATRRECRDFPGIIYAQHDILKPFPFDRDFDLVWCYGVLHHTGDFYGALQNIAGLVKPGGLLYFMAYAEPERGAIDHYAYYHEVAAMRAALTACSFADRARILTEVAGRGKALGWFDAVSSQINDTFTAEELYQMVACLGFENIRRTRPDERNHNIVATRKA